MKNLASDPQAKRTGYPKIFKTNIIYCNIELPCKRVLCKCEEIHSCMAAMLLKPRYDVLLPNPTMILAYDWSKHYCLWPSTKGQPICQQQQ